MKIYMIAGKARSGKDTLGDFLIKELEKKGKKPCRIQIAQYIKYYAMKYFGWDGSEETKPRDFLNHLGTDIIRNKINPDFHIDRLIEDFEVLSHFFDTFVVSDVRFLNEIIKTKNKFNDVVTIRIERESDELSDKQKNNETETALDDFNDFDFFVDNNGTLENLEEKAKKIIESK